MKAAKSVVQVLPGARFDPLLFIWGMLLSLLELIPRSLVYKKLLGYDVYFNTGTDEHGLKIRQSKRARSSGSEFLDKNFSVFKEQVKIFNLMDEVNFIRTTDDKHLKIAQSFWQKVSDNGYIYKKEI